MKTMIIAHGHPSLHKGGGEVAAYSIHQMLLDAGHESVFVGWGGRAQASGGGILAEIADRDYLLYTESEHFHFSSMSKNLIDGLRALLNKYKPDVVHLHHYVHLGIEAAAVIKQILPTARVVLTLHEYLAICANNGQLFTKSNEVCAGYRPERCHQCFPDISAAGFFMREIAIKSAFGFVDNFVSPSQFLADQYIKWGLPVDRISVIENPLLIQRDTGFGCLPAPRRGKRWKVGFFGQINYYKGLDLIVNAIRLATERGGKIEIGIHGKYSSVNGDSYIENLKTAIVDLGDSAIFHGTYRPVDVQTLMQQYHWVVMGSRWYENSPVVIQEAISAGVPLLVPDHGGMKEKVGEAGIRYQPGSAFGLAGVLSHLTKSEYQRALDAVNMMRSEQALMNARSFERLLMVYAGCTTSPMNA